MMSRNDFLEIMVLMYPASGGTISLTMTRPTEVSCIIFLTMLPFSSTSSTITLIGAWMSHLPSL